MDVRCMGELSSLKGEMAECDSGLWECGCLSQKVMKMALGGEHSSGGRGGGMCCASLMVVTISCVQVFALDLLKGGVKSRSVTMRDPTSLGGCIQVDCKHDAEMAGGFKKDTMVGCPIGGP